MFVILLPYVRYDQTMATVSIEVKWCPIMFCLIVNDFGIEYVGDQHLDHLRQVLKKHCEITEDLEGKNCLHRL